MTKWFDAETKEEIPPTDPRNPDCEHHEWHNLADFKDIGYLGEVELLVPPVYHWNCFTAPKYCISFEKAPNWFWRKMQYLLLGWRWERIK